MTPHAHTHTRTPAQIHPERSVSKLFSHIFLHLGYFFFIFVFPHFFAVRCLVFQQLSHCGGRSRCRLPPSLPRPCLFLRVVCFKIDKLTCWRSLTPLLLFWVFQSEFIKHFNRGEVEFDFNLCKCKSNCSAV